MPSSSLTEINEECDLTKTKTSTNKESTKVINQPSCSKAFENESIPTQKCQSLPVHNPTNDDSDDYTNVVYGTSNYQGHCEDMHTFLNYIHRPVDSTSPFNSKDLLRHVLGKQRLVDTSSPCNTSMESPADQIFESVGPLQCFSPLSTNGLYHQLNETIPTESENQSSGSKRHNDASITMDSSTKSFESSDYSSDDESIVAKRQCILGLESSTSGTSSSQLKITGVVKFLEDGEKYINRHVYTDLSRPFYEQNFVLKLPPECKLTQGFITLFDDFATRIPFNFKPNETPKWQHFLNKNAQILSEGQWTRLWFKLEIINDPNALKDDDEDDEDDDDDPKMREITHPQTVILKYWLYPKHVEQNREPGGIIDLSGCVPEETRLSEPRRLEILTAAQPFRDLSNGLKTLRVLFTPGYQVQDYAQNKPLLLAFDTLDERDMWCATINGAVNVIAAHQEQLHHLHEFRRKQQFQKK